MVLPDALLTSHRDFLSVPYFLISFHHLLLIIKDPLNTYETSLGPLHTERQQGSVTDLWAREEKRGPMIPGHLLWSQSSHFQPRKRRLGDVGTGPHEGPDPSWPSAWERASAAMLHRC